MSHTAQLPQSTPASAARAGVARFAPLALYLALGVAAIDQLDILNPGFRRIVYLALGASVLSLAIPRRFQLGSFVAFSIGCLAFLLGTPTATDRIWEPIGAVRAAIVLGIGVVLIAICRLNIRFWWRAALLLAAGAVAAAFRSGYLPSGGYEVVWVILASMFMFRVMIHLYDVSTMPTRPTWTQSLAYFFLFPNAGFTLFPVIDFKTFCRSHLSEDRLQTYQRGLSWIFRGIVHLVLFRFADQIVAIPIEDVDRGVNVVRYLVSNCLIYLSVSGSFHLLIGLLLLFGFNLPPTNRHYFLASSFTDYWRRTNIYWKDFMIKVFYYPVFFRLKRRGQLAALVGATITTFVVTWALHLYQTWWLKGEARISTPDSLFWAILGALVLVNSLHESGFGRKGTRARANRDPRREIAATLLKTVGTFSTIALLWSLWCSPSVGTWLGIWKHADLVTFAGCAGILALVAAAKFAIDILPTLRVGVPTAVAPKTAPWGPLHAHAAALVLLIAIVQPGVGRHLPDPGLDHIHPKFTRDNLLDVLMAGDSFLTQKQGDEYNYYKQLTTLDEVNRQRMELMMARSVPVIPHDGHPPIVAVEDLRRDVLLPNQRTRAYEIEDFRTNRWGMRDRDYNLEPLPGTLRIALLGSSHAMGYAVPEEAGFGSVLEAKLNQAKPAGLNAGSVELLNFAKPGWSPLAQLEVLHETVARFSPDVVMLVAHVADLRHNNITLRRTLQQKGDIPFPYLRQVLEHADVTAWTPDGLAEQRLHAFEHELTDWSYRMLAEECRRMGVTPLFVFVPAIGFEYPLSDEQAGDARFLLNAAGAAGFTTIDLTTVFDGHDPEDLVTGIVPHCNELAHRLIAQALHRRLSEPVFVSKLERRSRVRSHAGPGATSAH